MSHNRAPVLNKHRYPQEKSSVFRDFRVFTTWGTNELVVVIAAAIPSAVIQNAVMDRSF
jgi:hypothetical protein